MVFPQPRVWQHQQREPRHVAGAHLGFVEVEEVKNLLILGNVHSMEWNRDRAMEQFRENWQELQSKDRHAGFAALVASGQN